MKRLFSFFLVAILLFGAVAGGFPCASAADENEGGGTVSELPASFFDRLQVDNPEFYESLSKAFMEREGDIMLADWQDAYSELVQDVQEQYGTTKFSDGAMVFPIEFNTSGLIRNTLLVDYRASSGWKQAFNVVSTSMDSHAAIVSGADSTAIGGTTTLGYELRTKTVLERPMYTYPCNGFVTVVEPLIIFYSTNCTYVDSEIYGLEQYSKSPTYVIAGAYLPTVYAYSYLYQNHAMFSYRLRITDGYLIFTPEGSSEPAGIEVNGHSNMVTANGSIMVNLEDKTYYSPTTNEYVNYNSYYYDYADRSYHMTTVSSDEDGNETPTSVTVTYGDEILTIVENSNNTTNTYNYYYTTINNDYTDPTPTPTPTPTPPTPPSPAPSGTTGGGDNVAVDGDGNTGGIFKWWGDLVINVGDIFDNAFGAPFGTETDTEGEGGSGFFAWLGERLGAVLSALADLILTPIKAVVEKLVELIVSLVGKIAEGLSAVLNTALSLLDIIPNLFTSFGEFLGEAFGFIPPEMMNLLTFGILVAVLIAVIKLIFGR